MVACRCSSQNQLLHPLPVLNRIVQRQKATKASATDDYWRLNSSKVLAYTLDVVNNLFKTVGLGVTALAVATIVERQDAISLLGERRVCSKVGAVIA